MAKLRVRPRASASRRRIRAPAAWNVATHNRCASGPTSFSTRWRSSPAALFVNVTARISGARARRSRSRCAIRCVSTRVLPEPAPARMSKGPSPWRTASSCGGLRTLASGSDTGGVITQKTVRCGGAVARSGPHHSARRPRRGRDELHGRRVRRRPGRDRLRPHVPQRRAGARGGGDRSGYALLTEAGLVIHTGDFKIDWSPVDGKLLDVRRFAELGETGVACLLSDSTNAEREGTTPSEREVGESLIRIFAGPLAKGRVVV